MARNYSNVAEETALTAGINGSATSIAVGSNTGYPSVPYTVILDPGLPTEEVCEVTGVAGTTWTVTRGVDGTPAASHDNGAVVVHGWSARDLRDSQEHIAATSNVHGVTGSLVGTSNTQTLSNKTLTSPTINGGTLNSVTLGTGLTLQSPTLVTPTIASFTSAQHLHTNAASGGLIATGGGGGFTGLAYRRTGGSQSIASTTSNEAGARPLAFSSLSYNVGGNATWAVNGPTNRITLPTDVDDAVWHISANVSLTLTDPELDIPLVVIAHQDHGNIAVVSNGDDLGGLEPQRKLSLSTDIQSDSGRWIEIRLGSMGDAGIDFSVATCNVSIHRVA